MLDVSIYNVDVVDVAIRFLVDFRVSFYSFIDFPIFCLQVCPRRLCGTLLLLLKLFMI